jgi:RNA polymerase sigma-70 factor (ECF subfamily)
VTIEAAIDVAPGAQAPADVAATQQVVERFKDMVFAIALTHTRCKGDAEDAFQEVFLAYHRKQPPTNGDDHLKAWLITTTLNCARRQTSASWRTRVVPLTPEAADRAAPQVFHFATEDQDVLFHALAGLPETYRTVLHLFYFEDLPTARIGQILGLETGAVKMRLSRGRAILRDQLKGELFND